MQRAEIKTQLCEIIAQEASDFNVKGDVPDATALLDIGLDSLKLITIVFDVENAFSIKIEPSEQGTIRTVGDVVSLVEKKLQAKAGK